MPTVSLVFFRHIHSCFTAILSLSIDLAMRDSVQPWPKKKNNFLYLLRFAWFAKMMLLSRVAAACVALFAVSVTYVVRNYHYHDYSPYLRYLSGVDRKLQHVGHSSKPLGYLTLDFYNSYVINSFGNKQFAMEPWRIDWQLQQLNRWYRGRIRFIKGDVYEYNNPKVYLIPPRTPNPWEPCIQVRAFADGPDVRRKDRINVLLSSNLNSNFMLSCVSQDDFPLGQPQRATAFIMGANFKSWFGGAIAHAVGRILGFGYTSDDIREGERRYVRCGNDVRYPFFRNDDLSDGEVVVGNTTYLNKDWVGRACIMARFRIITLIWYGLTGQIGLFINGYTDGWEKIAACWLRRTNNTLIGNGYPALPRAF